MYIDIHKIWWFFNNRCLLRRKHRCTFLSQLKIMISGDLGRLSTKMVVSGIFALNIEVRIAAQSPVIPAVPGVITPPLPPRCWPPRIEMAAANIRKSYRNLRPHFHRRQLMEGVGVLSTQYFISDTLCGASVDVLLLTWFFNLHCSAVSRILHHSHPYSYMKWLWSIFERNMM